MRYTGCSLVPVLPWIPLYPDRDVVATQVTKAVLEHMQVLTTPHLALFDIIDSFASCCQIILQYVHQSQLLEGAARD
jgi:hypothetical protein